MDHLPGEPPRLRTVRSTMRWAAFTLILATTLFGGGGSAFADPDPKPQRPEAFLRDWVRGEARFEMYTSLHRWAGDTHRADTEAFEVAVKALALRESGSVKTRSTLARDLVRTFRSSESNDRARLRALHVLGRLAAPEGLHLLVQQSRAEQLEAKVAAIRALGFFGNAPAKESFLVYGGRIRYVVLPSAENAAATRALLKAVDAARSQRHTEKGVGARRAFRTRMRAQSRAIADALRAHRSADVLDKLLAVAVAPGALRLDHDDLVEMLARCAHRVGVEPLVRALTKGATSVRLLVAQALGQSARKAAVNPLRALLGDADPSVVTAAHAALTKLAGNKTVPAGTEHPQDLKPGVYKLGA